MTWICAYCEMQTIWFRQDLMFSKLKISTVNKHCFNILVKWFTETLKSKFLEIKKYYYCIANNFINNLCGKKNIFPADSTPHYVILKLS